MGEKTIQLTKKVWIIVIAIVISCLIISFIVSTLSRINVAGACAGIGTLFLELLIISKHSIKNIIKKWMPTTAKVVSCERKKTHDVNGAVTSDCYDVTYQIFTDNTITQHIKSSNVPVEINKIINVYYDYNKDKMVTENEIIGDKIKKWYKLCISTSIVLYAISIVIIAVSMFGIMDSLKDTAYNGLTYTIGPVFAAIGFYFLIKSIQFKLSKKDIQKVDGELIEYAKERDLDNYSRYVYYPIYKYWYNGEYKEYKSSIGRNRRKKKISDSVELLIDKSGYIREKREIKSQLFSGIMFLMIGVILTVAMLYPLINVYADSVNNTTNNSTIIYAVGPVFILAGLLMLKSFIITHNNKSYTAKVKGTLVEYIERTYPTSIEGQYSYDVSYYPVYEYFVNGQTKMYESSIGRCKQNKKIGETTTLFIDEKERVYEKSDAKSTLWIGILLLLVGFAITGFVFYPTIC